MMSENLVKGILGIRRFLSGKWINDVTVSARADAGV